MVIHAEDRLGQVKTYQLPESSVIGNWGKTAAHQSQVPREKKPKVVKGAAIEVLTSLKKRGTPDDDQHIAEGTHSRKQPRPKKLVRISSESDIIPETPPRGSTPTVTPSSSLQNGAMANNNIEYKEAQTLTPQPTITPSGTLQHA